MRVALAIPSLAVLPLLCFLAPAAESKDAQCSTTDDGNFSCEFRPTAEDGSFEISAPGKPTFILVVEEPGVAFGFLKVDGNNVRLPGRYLRSDVERACWINDVTEAKVCAW